MAQCLESLNSFILALEVQNSSRAQQEARRLFCDLRAYAIPGADEFVYSLQPGGGVYGVSNSCVVEEPISPEIADDCRPTVNANAGSAEGMAASCQSVAQSLRQILHGQSQGHRPLRLVILRGRSTEEPNHRIADDFVDGCTVLDEQLGESPPRYSFNMSASSSGASLSLRGVKSSTSVNTQVTMRLSPPRLSAAGSLTISRD